MLLARVWGKLAFLVLTNILIGLLIFWGFSSILKERWLSRGVVLVVPLKNTLWQGFGLVIEPELTLPLKTPRGFISQAFLLDSGALVSSLPREKANQLGLKLAFLPRSVFVGYGGETTFAYQGQMTVKLGSQEKTLPVVFTESYGTRAILGRKEFFEQYTILFDHERRIIEIRK